MKHSCLSLFLMKLQGQSVKLYWKYNTATDVFTCDFCEFLWNNFFEEHLGVIVRVRLLWKKFGGKETLSIQFVTFKTVGFDVKTSFASRPSLRLIRWYNKPGDITKEFWEKAIQLHGTFHELKITNWTFKEFDFPYLFK